MRTPVLALPSVAFARTAALTLIVTGAITVASCKEPVAPAAQAAPLTVAGVLPDADLLGGGSSVTIAGTNFVDVISVRIGGSELVNRTVVSSTRITGTTPTAADTGAADVVVASTSRGTAKCTGCFHYLRLLLPVSAAAILRSAAFGHAPTAAPERNSDPPRVCARPDTTWIEAVGPAPEGGWIRTPVVRRDTIPC